MEDSTAPDFAAIKAELNRLAALTALEYEIERTSAARRLGMRADALDKHVAKLRPPQQNNDDDTGQQGQRLTLPEAEPWHEPVNGVVLLNQLAKYYGDHAFLQEGAATALALWTVHTYVFELFRHSPKLHVHAIAMNSGKTTILDLMELVVCRPLQAAHVTSSVLFRVIEMAKPTILLDEADTYLTDQNAQELRGVLNAGHKRGAVVPRCVGDDHVPRLFGVYAPVAIAGIGRLPGPIASRSVVIPMKRALRTELPTARIGRATEIAAGRLASQAVRWASDQRDKLAVTDPKMGELFGREADNWRVLFAVADVAGGDWPERVRRAVKSLAVTENDSDTLGVQLLSDLRDEFTAAEMAQKDHNLRSQEIVDRLIVKQGRPWPEMGRMARPLTQNRLARLLRPFKIYPFLDTTYRTSHYTLADFVDAFGRHLPSREGE